MKRIFRMGYAGVILFALSGIGGCKKSTAPGNSGGGGNGNGYYLRFKLDGVQTEYDSEPFGEITFNNSEQVYSLVMAAYKDVNAGAKNDVTIITYGKTTIAAGVGYNDPAKTQESNGTPLPVTTVFFNDSSGLGWLTAGALSDASGNTPIPGVVADAKLTITTLASGSIKGSFSGTAYKSSDFTKFHSITDGEFYVKRTQ